MGWAARDADKSVLPLENIFPSHFNTTEQNMITNEHSLLHFLENTLYHTKVQLTPRGLVVL